MSFVTRSGAELRIDGEKFRFIGVNFYPFIVETVSLSSIQSVMDACVSKRIPIIRTWCFDASFPQSDSAGNFRYLDYPLGSNIITNSSFDTDTTGWVLQAGFTRSNENSHSGGFSIKQNTGSGFNDFHTDTNGLDVVQNTDYVLTFWYNITVSGQGPLVGIDSEYAVTGITNTQLNSTSGEWKRKQVLFNSGANTKVWIRVLNFGGSVSGYWDDFHLGLKSTPGLVSREATFVQLDTLLAEAAKRDLKIVLSLADNPTYDTKQAYCRWVDTIYGTSLEAAGFPYIGFFQNANCKTFYKDFVRQLVTRRNTINGRLYINDDSIAWWELGNELRVDAFEGGNVNTLNSENLALLSKPNGWIDEMSRYIHSIDPNHLISFSSCAHGWAFATGDTVWNGTFYGVDYNIISALPYIDILDFHAYPTQTDNINLIKYGQRFGFPNAATGDGFRAQLRDYIKVGHRNNKPVICGEFSTGVRELTQSNSVYPLYPRARGHREVFKDFFGQGGDGMILWHGSSGAGGTYTINLNASGGEDINTNADDTNLVNLIREQNTILKRPNNLRFNSLMPHARGGKWVKKRRSHIDSMVT